MNLTPALRWMLFALIVVAFAGLGLLLLRPPSQAPQAGGPSRARPPAARASRAPATPAPATPTPGTPTPGTPTPGTPAPGTTPGPGAASLTQDPAVDIFHLLPFSQVALDQAVAVTRRFAADYGTYSYRQDAAAYVAPMRGLITTQLAAVLARGYATAGLAQTRLQQKQVSVGSADVTGLRAFGATSLTFVVTVAQKITSLPGSSRLTGDYAVTVTLTGGHWLVSDIELATAGNS